MITDIKSLQLVMHKHAAQTFTGKLRSPVVAGNGLSTASLRTVSGFDRVYDSDQNREDYCIKWLYNSSKWDVEKKSTSRRLRVSVSFCRLLPDFCEPRLAAAAITESPSDTSD